MNYYNDVDAFVCQWARNLIEAGHAPYGKVDERSIRLVRPADIAGFEQCHFFSGVLGWSYALRLAGWPDDRPVWTASCPCQPFSTAGQRRGTDDDRHLWPVLFDLIRECRPAILLGEQVASPDGRAWFDAVSADMEGAGYAVGAANLCAAGVGAPHIRQRLYFVAVADATGQRCARFDALDESRRGVPQAAGRGAARELANASSGGRGAWSVPRDDVSERTGSTDDGRMGDADGEPSGRDSRAVPGAKGGARRMRNGDHGPRVAGRDVLPADPWSDAEWIACTDGKSRPAQPGSFPLAHGVPTRMGAGGAMEARNRRGELAGYGNAIVPEVAATFIRAVMA